jgi:LacI family transcriptional regulator
MQARVEHESEPERVPRSPAPAEFEPDPEAQPRSPAPEPESEPDPEAQPRSPARASETEPVPQHRSPATASESQPARQSRSNADASPPDSPIAATRPTSHDVARLARVSQATVSRALATADSPVAPATRRRVELAARRLGSLSTRRTRQVGVVVDDLGNPFYLELIDTLHRALDAAGLRLVVLTPQRDQSARALRLLDGSLDGAVLTTVALRSSLPSQLARRRFPFVLLNRETAAPQVADSCVLDNEEGARRVALELARLGHRRIAAVLGPATTSTAQQRERGLRRGLADHGIELAARLTRRGSFSFATGHRAMRSLMSIRGRPSAVFAANDVIAMGALNSARGLGIKVPDDVTLVGFDDIGMAGWELFSLTTVRQDLARMTEIATELLIARIADPDRPLRRVVLPAQLVLRATHGPPAAQA